MLNETDVCETIRVVRDVAPGGFVVINASDRQPDDILFEEEVKEPQKKGKPAR